MNIDERENRNNPLSAILPPRRTVKEKIETKMSQSFRLDFVDDKSRDDDLSNLCFTTPQRQQPTTNNQQPTTNNQQPTTNNQQQQNNQASTDRQKEDCIQSLKAAMGLYKQNVRKNSFLLLGIGLAKN